MWCDGEGRAVVRVDVPDMIHHHAAVVTEAGHDHQENVRQNTETLGKFADL